MRKYLLLLLILSANLFGFAQTTSQTRTANYFHNNYANGTNITNYVQWGAQYVADDDNSYAYTGKINKIQRVYLILQDFRFEIPSDAIIQSITVKVRRFKSGKGQVKDCFVRLRTTRQAGGSLDYGPEMANTTTLWPAIETEASYNQTGTGNNGIVNPELNTTGPYQWTPALINHSLFGLYLATDFPKQGFYYAYFDKAEITVVYSSPETGTRKSPDVTEAKPLKEPIIYPNPFTTKANIQFTASENGNAVVELYNISGTKIRTLFTGNVEQGQVYTVTTGDALLPKGIYVYKIGNGKQKQTGRMIKLE